MKLLTSIIIGILIFLLGCFLDYTFVFWLTDAIGTPAQWQFLVKLALFILTGSTTIALSIFAGAFGGAMVEAWISHLIAKRNRKSLQKRK